MECFESETLELEAEGSCGPCWPLNTRHSKLRSFIPTPSFAEMRTGSVNILRHSKNIPFTLPFQSRGMCAVHLAGKASIRCGPRRNIREFYSLYRIARISVDGYVLHRRSSQTIWAIWTSSISV